MSKENKSIQTVLLSFKKNLLPPLGHDENRNTGHCSILSLQFPAIINRLYINRGTRCEPSVSLVRSNFHSVGKSPLQYSNPNVCFLKTTPLQYLFLGSTRYYTIFWVLIRLSHDIHDILKASKIAFFSKSVFRRLATIGKKARKL